MQQLVSYIQTDPEYTKNPFLFVAELSCNLIQGLNKQEQTVFEDAEDIIKFGELMLSSFLRCLENVTENDLDKIYGQVDYNYSVSKTKLLNFHNKVRECL